MLHLGMISVKSFVAAGDEEEAMLLPVKVIAKAKSAFPVDAGLSRLRCRYIGRRKRAIGSVSTKILGFILQQHLSFDLHVTELLKQCSQHVYLLQHLLRNQGPVDQLSIVLLV